MKKEYRLLLLGPLFIIGAVLYYRFLLGPVGGFILYNIISPIWGILIPNPNIMEGMIGWVFSLALFYVLFFIPYIIVFLIVAVLCIKYAAQKSNKSIILPLLVVALVIIGYSYPKNIKPENHNKRQQKETVFTDILKDGDIIFHISQSEQSKAIQLATKSKYSHCGIIYKLKSKYYVFEAVQPIKFTPLNKWIARGKNGHCIIKRLKNADEVLSPETLSKMRQVAKGFISKNYDLTFEWSDDKLYCSELVWKVYERGAGIEIGKLSKLSDFDLTDEEVKVKIKERYGDKVPTNETVISPAAIFDSELLVTVKIK